MTQKEQEIYQLVYDFLKDRKNNEFIIPYLEEDDNYDNRDDDYWSDYEFELRTWSKDLYNGCAETVSIHKMYINEESDDLRFDLMYIFWNPDGCMVEDDIYICEENLTFEEIKEKLYNIESLAYVINTEKEAEESMDE